MKFLQVLIQDLYLKGLLTLLNRRLIVNLAKINIVILNPRLIMERKNPELLITLTMLNKSLLN